MSLRVGTTVVTLEEARSRVIAYLTSSEYAWQHYDAYETNDDPNRLCDGDLLAPVLLNVGVTLKTFGLLRDWRPDLEAALGRLPPGRHLHEASDEELDRVAECFDVLGSRPFLGTTVAKVLHRKHPRLLPLYDRRVRARYLPERVPRAKGRSWAEFMRLLAAEMQADLLDGHDEWSALCAVPEAGDRLTPLRALDILAWWPAE